MVDTLVEMGFAANAATQALLLCHNNLESAAEMLVSNPPPVEPEAESVPGSTRGTAARPASARDDVLYLMSMGFDESRATGAIERHGNLEAALDALLMDPPADPAPPLAAPRRRRSLEAEASAPEVVPGNAKRARREEPLRASPISPISPPEESHPPPEPKPSEPGAEPSDGDATHEFSVEVMAKRLKFGARSFEGLKGGWCAESTWSPSNVREKDVKKIVLASYPQAAKMRGQRGERMVTEMLCACFQQGLWTFGDANVPTNQEVIPAFRFIMSEMAKLDAKNLKRVGIITTLAHACEDCQQVQAREILRIFGDLTAQNESFDEQLKYSLLRLKEAAVNRFITQHHGEKCDLDHTKVYPRQQRPHLFSGYVDYIGEELGLDGMKAAQGDRFLHEVRKELKKIKMTKTSIIKALMQEMSVREWLQTLLADINNQNPVADRLMDRSCIFTWVQANLSREAAHLVFYDEDRAEEFKGQDPEEPSAENCYQPFLSCKVLVEMLVKARFLEEVSEDASASGSRGS